MGRRLSDARRRGSTFPRDGAAGRGRRAPELPERAGSVPAEPARFEPELEQMRLALTLGLRDYVSKNEFGEVVVRVSGGIDSAVTAALCVDALGAERVHCVSMPSRFSSEETMADARRLAEGLGCDFLRIAIEDVVQAFHDSLAEPTGGLEGPAAENLQARVRGVLLMAL